MYHTVRRSWSMINMIDVLDRSDSEIEYRDVLLEFPGSGLGI